MTGLYQCTACPNNTYSISTTECTACHPHTVSASGSDNRTDCICIPGYTLNETTAMCDACAPGMYKSWVGFGECLVCPEGTHSNGSAAAACTSCPNDDYSPALSSSVSDCVESCGPGTASNGARGCIGCSMGFYSNASWHNFNCSACPANSDSPLNSTSIDACDCNPGFTAVSASHADGCYECPGITYKGVSGQQMCTDCPPLTLPNANKTFCECAPGFQGPILGPCCPLSSNYFLELEYNPESITTLAPLEVEVRLVHTSGQWHVAAQEDNCTTNSSSLSNSSQSNSSSLWANVAGNTTNCSTANNSNSPAWEPTGVWRRDCAAGGCAEVRVWFTRDGSPPAQGESVTCRGQDCGAMGWSPFVVQLNASGNLRLSLERLGTPQETCPTCNGDPTPARFCSAWKNYTQNYTLFPPPPVLTEWLPHGATFGPVRVRASGILAGTEVHYSTCIPDTPAVGPPSRVLSDCVPPAPTRASPLYNQTLTFTYRTVVSMAAFDSVSVGPITTLDVRVQNQVVATQASGSELTAGDMVEVSCLDPRTAYFQWTVCSPLRASGLSGWQDQEMSPNDCPAVKAKALIPFPLVDTTSMWVAAYDENANLVCTRVRLDYTVAVMGRTSCPAAEDGLLGNAMADVNPDWGNVMRSLQGDDDVELFNQMLQGSGIVGPGSQCRLGPDGRFDCTSAN